MLLNSAAQASWAYTHMVFPRKGETTTRRERRAKEVLRAAHADPAGAQHMLSLPSFRGSEWQTGQKWPQGLSRWKDKQAEFGGGQKHPPYTRPGEVRATAGEAPGDRGVKLQNSL